MYVLSSHSLQPTDWEINDKIVKLFMPLKGGSIVQLCPIKYFSKGSTPTKMLLGDMLNALSFLNDEEIAPGNITPGNILFEYGS